MDPRPWYVTSLLIDCNTVICNELITDISVAINAPIGQSIVSSLHAESLGIRTIHFDKHDSGEHGLQTDSRLTPLPRL